MAAFRILWLLMGLLAVFLGNDVHSISLPTTSLLGGRLNKFESSAASASKTESSSKMVKTGSTMQRSASAVDSASVVDSASEAGCASAVKTASATKSASAVNSASAASTVSSAQAASSSAVETDQQVAGSKKTSSSSVTTTRSVTVEKKTTVYKKKSWSDLISYISEGLNTLEMCQKYGYNVQGLYVVPEFLRLLKSLNREQTSMASRITYPRDYSLSVQDGDEFDVIVVGCGAAGSILAGKLSDQKDLRVLLLEAGTTPLMQSEIPGLWANSIGTEMDWKYYAEPDETFGQSLDGKRVKIVRGKCYGGTTALNTMLYDHGVESDYNKFETAGLTKWCWKDVLKYYSRTDDCKFEAVTTHETVNKTQKVGGKMSVDSLKNTKTVEIKSVYSKALKAITGTDDLFDEKNHKGFVSSKAIVSNGLRVNAAKAFLKNADKKYNLKISARSLVKKVIFEDGKAVGVEFENSVGELIRVKSAEYVILSAGPIGTPKLLMESGVGPKEQLAALGVPAVVENDNVGRNLQAHPGFMGLVVKFETPPIKSYSISEMVFEYLMKHTGPLATVGMCSFTGFIDIDGNGAPEIQIINYYYSQDDTVFMPSQLDTFNFNDAVTEQIIDLNEKNDIQIIGISLLRPKNTGKLTLAKAGDGYAPVVEFGSLADEDVATLLKSIEWVKKLVRSEAFKKYGPTIVPLKIEGGPEPDVDSDEYWKHVIKHLTLMNIQMTGTSSMATEQDAGGVVGEDLEVFGTEGLVVADSSVLPIMFSAESCAPTMMVAEKAVDIIKKKLYGKEASKCD